MSDKTTLEMLGEEEEFYGQFPGGDHMKTFCEGPHCTPDMQNGRQVGVICPIDCTLCGINGDSLS
jgi:hypothetical protein